MLPYLLLDALVCYLMMSKRKEMLTDAAFRRTKGCTKYAQLLGTKAIQPFPIKRLKGKDLSLKWLQVDGLNEPLIVEENCRTLGMKVPDAGTTLSDVARIIKPDHPIKFIEVGEQNEVRPSAGRSDHVMRVAAPT